MPALAAGLSLLSVAGVIAVTLLGTRQAPLPLAFGAMAAASIFIVPFAEQHHYTLAALPVCVAVGEWSRGIQRSPGRASALRTTGLLLSLSMLLIGLPLPYESPALARGALALLAYPRLYGGLLLWGLLLWLARPAARLVTDQP